MFPFELIALAATLPVVVLTLLRWPAAGTWIIFFLVYLNVPAIATRLWGVPAMPVLALGILIAPALIQTLLIYRGRVALDKTFLLMFVFLGIALTSTFFAQDEDLALQWVTRYLLEGLLLYFLIINLVRRLDTLRQVTWALLIAGALLGALTLYQEVSHSYSNEFWGLAQRTLERETPTDIFMGTSEGQTKIRLAQRAQGPIDDPNRFAQMLLVLLPLGWFRMKDEPGLVRKVLAGGATLLILSGTLLTYSRGGFLGLTVMLLVLVLLKGIPVRQVLAAAAVMVLAVALLAPGYVGRIMTLQGLEGLVGGKEAGGAEPDAVQRGRATEMLAAWNAMVDHPVLGVGPGQFAPIYSVTYMSEYFLLRHVTEQRRAHSLYLEMGAELGAIGLLTFLGIVAVTLKRLAGVRRGWSQYPEISNYAVAFIAGIASYLVTALFLQLSFQRYFWTELALGGSTVIAAQALPRKKLVPRESGPRGHDDMRDASRPARSM